MLPPIHQSKSHAPHNPHAKNVRTPTPAADPIDVIDLAPIDPIEPIAVTRSPLQPPLAEPPAPRRPRRFIDKVATFCVQALCVIILAGIVIPIAGVGVPIGGGWYLHSVWLGLIIGLAVALPLEYVLAKLAGLMGLQVKRTLLVEKNQARTNRRSR